MSEELPCSDFNWSRDMKTVKDVLKHDNGDYGYFLEVDLAYTAELRDVHADYPLAPETLTVSTDMVSDFSNQIYSHYHEEKPCKDENLKNHSKRSRQAKICYTHSQSKILFGERFDIEKGSSMY